MKRIEVRCCCTPNKLLGTLPVPDAVRDGSSHTFPLMQPRTYGINSYIATDRARSKPRTLTLPIDTFADLTGAHTKYGIAVKAEGVDVATLRLIPGFIEAVA